MGKLLLLIVVLSGIGLAGYYWQQQQARLQAMSSELKAMEQSIRKAQTETTSPEPETAQLPAEPGKPGPVPATRKAEPEATSQKAGMAQLPAASGRSGNVPEKSSSADQSGSKVSMESYDREDLRKLLVRCKATMPPDMVMLARLVERLQLLQPPSEIELAGKEAVGIGAELNHPSPAGKTPDLPGDCMKSPPCSVCRGQPPAAGCAACGGTGFQTEETLRVTSRGAIRTRKPLLPVYHRESAIAAYRKRIAMLEVWVESR